VADRSAGHTINFLEARIRGAFEFTKAILAQHFFHLFISRFWACCLAAKTVCLSSTAGGFDFRSPSSKSICNRLSCEIPPRSVQSRKDFAPHEPRRTTQFVFIVLLGGEQLFKVSLLLCMRV